MAAAGVALAGPLSALAIERKAVAASDRIRVGLIGCRGMGWSNMSSLLKLDEVECVALCDVDEREVERRKEDAVKRQEKTPRLFGAT